MPSFILTFTKTIQCSVKANSREELERAAKKEVEDRLSGWDTSNSAAPWEVEISQAHPSQEPLIKKWDCGVAGGRILAFEDYEKEAEARLKPAGPQMPSNQRQEVLG